MDPVHRKGILMGAAAFTCWGLLSPGNAILLEQYPPMWMQSVRSVLALAIPALWFGRRRFMNALRLLQRPPLLVAMFVGTVMSFGLFIYSQTRIDAAYTTLGFYTAPLWTAMLGWLWMREQVGWSFLPAVAGLGVGGWMALTGGGSVPAPDALGMGLAVASGLGWGAYAVLLRKHGQGIDWRELLLASMMLGAVIFTVLAAVTEPLPAFRDFTQKTWVWTAIQVTIPTLAALALFQSALRMAPSAQVNILVALELAATVFFVWLLLGFTFNAIELLGVWICLISVAGYIWWRSQPETAAPPL